MPFIKDRNRIYFYANGIEFVLPSSLSSTISLLTASQTEWQKGVVQATKRTEFVTLLTQLINQGDFYFREDDS